MQKNQEILMNSEKIQNLHFEGGGLIKSIKEGGPHEARDPSTKKSGPLEDDPTTVEKLRSSSKRLDTQI